MKEGKEVDPDGKGVGEELGVAGEEETNQYLLCFLKYMFLQ